MMSASPQPVHVFLQVSAGGDAGAEELDRQTRRLLAELREMEVESAELAPGGPPPPGAKSADAVTLGALAVAVLPSFFPKLVEFLQSWAQRGESRTVKIKTQVGEKSLEVEYSPTVMSREDLQDTVAALMAALQGTSDDEPQSGPADRQ